MKEARERKQEKKVSEERKKIEKDSELFFFSEEKFPVRFKFSLKFLVPFLF